MFYKIIGLLLSVSQFLSYPFWSSARFHGFSLAAGLLSFKNTFRTLFSITSVNLIFVATFWLHLSMVSSKAIGTNRDICVLLARSLLWKIWKTNMSTSLMTPFKRKARNTVNFKVSTKFLTLSFKSILSQVNNCLCRLWLVEAELCWISS